MALNQAERQINNREIKEEPKIRTTYMQKILTFKERYVDNLDNVERYFISVTKNETFAMTKKLCSTRNFFYQMLNVL